MSLSPGDRVDRYEVIELLGSGGMGEVYRARDSKLARLVALKILRVGPGQGTDGATRLLREARAAASLSHANVVAVFDVGEVQEPEALRGLPYIAMELVVGKSLRSYVGDPSVSMERRCAWLRDVALALGAAHQAGIVHRDVKPENVMIRADGAVKVLDFGIARRVMSPIDRMASTGGQSVPNSMGSAEIELLLGTLTEEGKVIGTPYYMAPEQLRAEGIDGRTDQFAWAVVAYELLTGAAPWKRNVSPLATVSEILSVAPVAPVEVDGSIPRRWSDAIVRALAKQRGARFATMEALVASVEGRTPESERGAAARSPSTVSVPTEELRAIEPRKRHRSLARSLFTAAALVATVGIVVLLVRAARRATAASVSALLDARADEACTSNAGCSRGHGGGAWRCHSQRHVCVEIASPDCTVYAEARDLEAEDVVWLGGLFRLTEAGGLGDTRAIEIARQDFAAALGSSATRSGPLHARPIGVVMCDEGEDALRAARHLADDVEVPAVIGFRSTTVALATIPTVFLPAHVLSFVSISQAPEITRIPEPANEPRLVWRSTLNRLDFGVVLAHFISDVLEPTMRAGMHGMRDRPLKVAAVWPKAASHDVVESLFDALHYNGRSALDNDANFRQFVYERDADAGAEDVVQNLLAFAPQVIVYAERPFYSRVLAPLEAKWPTSDGSPRPVYLTGSGLGGPALQFAGRDPAKRHRFFAATNLSTTRTNAKLVLRYNLAFPLEPIVRTEAPQPSYDAFYALAYATYALGDAPVTGPALSRMIERLLPPGHPIDVGPVQIFEGFEALRSGERIDLNGAIGSLDFDPRSGEAPIDYAIVCLGVDDAGNASPPVDSGLVYDARAQKLVGTLRCP